jgi:DNA-binding transcriptional MerR regulator
MNGNYLLHEVAQRLGVKHYRIAYALTTGLVEEPEIRIAGKRIFNEADIGRLAAHFRVELTKDKGKHREAAADAVQ